MKLKKLISLCLAVGLTVATLAGCGESEKKSESTANTASTEGAAASSETSTITEPITFDIMGLLPNDTYPLEDNAVWKKMQEESGFVFNLTSIPASEVKEKTNLLLNGGDYGDVLFKLSAAELDDFGRNGTLVAIEDYIKEYMPNLSAMLDEAPNGWEVAGVDGHIYGLPYVSFEGMLMRNGMHMPYINVEWLDNLGLEMPDSYESLYEVLKAFKEEDANGNGDPNDEIPIIWDGHNLLRFQHTIGDAKHMMDWTALMDDQMDVLSYYPATEEFKEYLSWWNKYYEEGLVAVDVFVMTSDQVKAMTKTEGKVGIWLGNTPNNYVAEADRGNYKQIDPWNPDNVVRNCQIARNTLCITDKCDPEKIPYLLSYWDKFYTEEGWLMFNCGVDGDTQFWKDGGWYEDGSKYENSQQYRLNAGASAPFGATAEIQTKRYFDLSNPTDIANYQVHYESRQEGGMLNVGIVISPMSYTAEENEILSTKGTELSAYVQNYLAEVITGVSDLDATWDEFQETLKDMGSEEVLAVRQAAYDRMK